MAQSFKEFFECWLLEQSKYLEELVQASSNGTESEEHVKKVLIPLIEREIKHYEQYYETKSRWAKHEAFAMLNPSWTSSFEDGFLWIGGWRPSMAFHLLYSKTGLQFEEQLSQLLEGFHGNDLGGISAAQLYQIDKLQSRTIEEEREITEKMAKHQETVADPAMVELSHIVSELMRAKKGENEVEKEINQVESALATKKEGMVEILQSADDLRLRTLKEIVQILNPIQSVHFLIAGAELHLRVHDWGKRMDIPHAAGMEKQPEEISTTAS